jgi:hypothetical protein
MIHFLHLKNFPQVLTNLLETDDLKCKTGSLRVLREITIHPSIRRSVTLMGGIELLIKILSDPNPELQVPFCSFKDMFGPIPLSLFSNNVCILSQIYS